MTPDPWERQKGESRKAFAAFVVYRDMGESRSTEKVGKEGGKSWGLIQRWCTRWHWVDRCASYDDYFDRQQRNAREQEIIEMNRRHVTIARGLLARVTARLAKMNEEEIGVQSLAPLLRSAAEVERRGMGVSDRVEVTGAEGGPIQAEVEVMQNALGDPEARDLLRRLNRRLEDLSDGDGREVVAEPLE